MVDIKKKAKEIKTNIKEKTVEVDEFVKEHPYKTVGIVAGIAGALGVVAGWFLGRKKK